MNCKRCAKLLRLLREAYAAIPERWPPEENWLSGEHTDGNVMAIERDLEQMQWQLMRLAVRRKWGSS